MRVRMMFAFKEGDTQAQFYAACEGDGTLARLEDGPLAGARHCAADAGVLLLRTPAQVVLVLKLVRFGLRILARHGRLSLGSVQIRLRLALAVIEVTAGKGVTFGNRYIVVTLRLRERDFDFCV